jgi:hypothetical protein
MAHLRQIVPSSFGFEDDRGLLFHHQVHVLPSLSPAHPQPWLIRIPEIFDTLAPEILCRLEATPGKRLGLDYHWVGLPDPSQLQNHPIAKFIRWNLPVEHSWPCNPSKIEGFIEKASQALQAKFAARSPQAIFTGVLHPTSPDRYFRSLAGNLRGRMLQVFAPTRLHEVEEQDAERETLFCLVGKEGLYAGVQSPRHCNGLFAGGSKFIDQNSPDTISRAGAKIAEALHYLRMHQSPLPAGSHWLELGACPGGMTSELLARKQRVTAIDKSPLDPRLSGRPGLRFVHADVAEFQPEPNSVYDALLNDMNGPPEESIDHVRRLSKWLKPEGIVVFTLKLPKVEDLDGPCALFDRIVKRAQSARLRLFAQTHLTYNRHEFTLFFRRT